MTYDIRNVKNITDLISYFSQNLGWDISIDDFDDIEDISYDFDAEDVGLKEDSFAKISSLRQLQPLVDGQKWGIFCVEFDSNRFEVSALRKILSGLIPRRRNSADHAVWCQQDLLFICNWGSGNNRTIGVAHFEDKEKGLPQIKMISCAPALEDFTQIKVFEDRLSQLAWPKNTRNIEEWRQAWSSAFTTAYRQTIQDSSTLTIQLAAEAQNIRDRILEVLDVESRNGYVHLLYNKFRDTLIHDMTEQEFADMYAQTVVYGLFSARCMDFTQDDFSAEEAVDCIPNTNPFLKSLMKECLGSQNNSKLSFDELEIGNVVELLMHTKTDEIITDFNRQTGGGKEDPVIHFYENFLTAYDKMQKVQRGVYYTPQPVVSFIVSAIDSIIKDEFGYAQGLASTDRKKIRITRRSKRKVDGYHTLVEDTEDVPAIQILDPATGTGTFIRQVILQIYENFKQNNKDLSQKELREAWNKYVPEHLLPRVNAFELMMAPYAVAHMKLAMVLRDTGYNFGSDSRLNVYLTNSLEKPGNSDGQLTLWSDPLAMESIAANAVKKNAGINIVLGNPPYSISSANKGKWILDLLSDYKKDLNERKVNLDDDYIKFIRYSQYVVQQGKGNGIIAFISNNSFLDGITHRTMRRMLLEQFESIYIINLHGNSKKKETAPNGDKDENVFDIQQGVSINILVAKQVKSKKMGRVYSYDLYGSREKKYDFLRSETLNSIKFEEIECEEPNYFFVPKDFSNADSYNAGFSIPELFCEYNSGVQTKRDKLVISFSEERVGDVLNDFASLSIEQIRRKYDLPADGRDWTIADAKADLKNHKKEIVKILYRPFDYRYTAYTGFSKGFMAYPRTKVFKHFMSHENVGLLVRRNTPPVDFTHVFVCDTLISEGVLGIDPNGREYVFPLYRYPDSESFIKCEDNMHDETKKKIAKSIGRESVAAHDVFCYVYATLHSNKYRKAFGEFLRIDFPRIPFPNNDEQFFKLVELGEKLINLHLLKFNIENSEKPFLLGEGSNEVKTIKFENSYIEINAKQKIGPVDEKIWNQFVGGYAPLQKWLKLRKGRQLSEEEILCYRKAVIALDETNRIMEDIDCYIEL